MSKLKANLVDSYARVVSAYLENNQVNHSEFEKLLRPIQQAMNEQENRPFEEVIDYNEPAQISHAKPADASEAPAKPREPKSQQEIDESITDHHLISFLDGKSYKTLKRHLGTHNETEHSYRQRFGLPASYPMVHPAYSEARSKMSKEMGLGRKPADRLAAQAAAKGTSVAKEAKARPNPKPSAKAAPKAAENTEQPDV